MVRQVFFFFAPRRRRREPPLTMLLLLLPSTETTNQGRARAQDGRRGSYHEEVRRVQDSGRYRAVARTGSYTSTLENNS